MHSKGVKVFPQEYGDNRVVEYSGGRPVQGVHQANTQAKC
jgi:hypothetical protein